MIPTRLLPQTVTIRRHLGGHPNNCGPPLTSRARVTGGSIFDSGPAHGSLRAFPAEITVYLPPDLDVPLRSIITLPGGGLERRVASRVQHVGRSDRVEFVELTVE